MCTFLSGVRQVKTLKHINETKKITSLYAWYMKQIIKFLNHRIFLLLSFQISWLLDDDKNLTTMPELV